MDIQLLFRSHQSTLSLNNGEEPVKKKPQDASWMTSTPWNDLYRIKIHFQKDDSSDAHLIGQLRYEWHGVRRSLRLERRKYLKKTLQATHQSPLKQAKCIRCAYLQLSKGLRELKKQQTLQRKGKKIRSCVPRSLEKRLRAAMAFSADHRERLWVQRAGFYRSFYLFLMQQPWLKRGWPLEPGVDSHGRVIELHGVDVEKAICRQSKSLDRAFAALRQLEGELDLFAVELLPHQMTDEAWQLFRIEQMQIALSALSCSEKNCDCPTSYINEKGDLVCETHQDGNRSLELSWLIFFQKGLQCLFEGKCSLVKQKTFMAI